MGVSLHSSDPEKEDVSDPLAKLSLNEPEPDLLAVEKSLAKISLVISEDEEKQKDGTQVAEKSKEDVTERTEGEERPQEDENAEKDKKIDGEHGKETEEEDEKEEAEEKTEVEEEIKDEVRVKEDADEEEEVKEDKAKMQPKEKDAHGEEEDNAKKQPEQENVDYEKKEEKEYIKKEVDEVGKEKDTLVFKLPKEFWKEVNSDLVTDGVRAKKAVKPQSSVSVSPCTEDSTSEDASGEDEDDEEEDGKKYISRGINDAQFQSSPEYAYSPYSAMSPNTYWDGSGMHDPFNNQQRGASYFNVSPAHSSTDGNESYLSASDPSNQLNFSNQYQYNQPLQFDGNFAYGQAVPGHIQQGGWYDQQQPSPPQQPLVPDSFGPLRVEDSPSPLMFPDIGSPPLQQHFSVESTKEDSLFSEDPTDLALVCEAFEKEINFPSRTPVSEAEVAGIKQQLMQSVYENQPLQPDMQVPQQFQPNQLPDYNTRGNQPMDMPDREWKMTYDNSVMMKYRQKFALCQNDRVTTTDADGDTATMILACKPAKETSDYSEVLSAVVGRQKNLDLHCDQLVVDGVCRLCGTSDPNAFYSSLSVRNKQGYTVLTSVMMLRQPTAVIQFLLSNLRRSDIPRIFSSNDAHIFSWAVQYYPELLPYIRRCQ